jgi:Holliday junction resolvase RusA-like endonuclease
MVPMGPVPQPRQRMGKIRFGRRAGRPVSYTPDDDPVHTYKQYVRLEAETGGVVLSGAVELRLLFVLPRPMSIIWKTRPMPRKWVGVKPDVDNLAKSTMDAMKGVWWVDDAQVAVLTVFKCYAAGGEEPFVEAWARSIEGDPVPCLEPVSDNDD